MITVITSAAILACMLPAQAAYAADATSCEFTVTADKKFVHPGDEVTFTLSVTPNGEVLGFEFDFGTLPTGFTYVEDSLTYLDTAKSTLKWTDFNAYVDDRIGFFVNDDTTAYSGGKLDIVTIKVKAGDEISKFEITPGEMIANNTVGDAIGVTLTQPDIKVPALKLVPETPATCEKEGNKAYYKCEDCDRIYETNDRTKPTTLDKVKTEKTAHDFSAEVVDAKYLKTKATCKDPAVYFKSCAICHEPGTETFTSGEKDPNNHGNIKVDTTTAKAATCTEDGYKGDSVCEDCGSRTKGDVIPATGHKGGKATCSAKAKCTECGEEYGELDPNNHAETEIKGAVEATVDKEGYTGDKVCKACGKIVEQGKKIPMKDPEPPMEELPDDPATSSSSASSSSTSSSSASSNSTPSSSSSSSSSPSSSASSSNTPSSSTSAPVSSSTQPDNTGNGNSGNTNTNGNSGNPATGITLTVVPVLLAAGAAVVIIKNKKR